MKALFAIAAMLLAELCAAQSYPSKPIRLIVPFPPGGGMDLVARMLSQKLAERLGQQVVVDNRGGANAIIGTDLAAKAAPDGYTIVLALPASVAVNPSLYRNLPYDPQRDLAAVSQLTSIALLLTAHPGFAANSVRDLVQLAKSKPAQLVFGSSGSGGSSHLAMELFKSMAHVEMTHVPYKGGGPALNDLVGGQIPLYAGPMITALPFVKSGRLKALGVTSRKRSSILPEVPAIAETIAGYESDSWQGVLAPKRTPPAIIELLQKEIAAILRQPEIRERLAGQGAEPLGTTPAEFDAYIKTETAKYAKVIRDARISAE